MSENKRKFEMPDIDELERKLDEPLESQYEIPKELKEGTDVNAKINPSVALGANGAASSKQNKDFVPEIPNFGADGPGRTMAMRGMILSICSMIFAVMCSLFAGIPTAANMINTAAFVCGICGIVFGVMGGNRNVSHHMPRGAMSWTGIVLGIVGILMSGMSFACIAACTGIRHFFGM